MSDEEEFTEPEGVEETTAPEVIEVETTEEMSVGTDDAGEAEVDEETGDATEPIADEAGGDVDAEESPAEAAEEEAEAEEVAPAKPAAKKKASAQPEAPKPAAKPASTRKRDQPSAPGEQVIVQAHARYVRSSARKARLVCDGIRGKSVPEARAILKFSPRHVAEAWEKLLNSAVANAENNNDLDADDLIIFSITADEGPTLKRFQPRAMGRATKIRKRTSHLSIQLTPKKGG